MEFEVGGPLFAPALSLDPVQHAGSLEREALSALRQSRFVDAYALADRRCRIRPLASIEAFLLRASALAGLGESEAAREDLRLALSIDPDNLAANRLLLRSGEIGERLEAARRILARETDWNNLQQVLRFLNRTGQGPVGSCRPGIEAIEGWVAWVDGDEPTLLVEGDIWSGQICLQRDEGHPLTNLQHAAATVRMPWSQVGDHVTLQFAGRQGVLVGAQHTRARRTPRVVPPLATRTEGVRQYTRRRVAVIVPVYDDFEATRQCFDGLLADRPTLVERRIVVVDDATPDLRIAAYLDTLHEQGAIELFRHRRNLGFAASVNTALDTVGDEDVCLLNADTLVPPGFLDALSQSANVAPDIGTATPLSNNGEYTSFPAAFRSNDLPDANTVERLHRAAARANAGLSIELPNGIGFCLYITNLCLRDVGKFSYRFGRGYYEDVEFCLRAKAAGWRSICAVDVFVGHAGSRSFKTEKAPLVHRNAKAISAAYRGFDAAVAAFVDQDPLKGARQALERELLPGSEPFVLLVAPEDMDRSSVEELVASEGAAGEPVVAARVGTGAGRISVRLRNSKGQVPQNLTFSYAWQDATRGFGQDLATVPVSRCVVCDPSRIPSEVLTVLPPAGKALTVHVHDRGGLCTIARTERGCPVCQGPCICDIEALHRARRPADAKSDQIALVTLLRCAESIIVPDRRVKFALECRIPGVANAIRVVEPPAPAPPTVREHSTLPRVGVWGDGAQPAVIELVIEIANVFQQEDDGASLICFGETPRDLVLKAAGPVFVTGEAEYDDALRLARRLSVKKMFFPSRRLEPPAAMMRLCSSLSLPIARFGEPENRRDRDNLYLPRSMKAREVARALHAWAHAA
jgi:GT2 family glycosyltransferase